MRADFGLRRSGAKSHHAEKHGAKAEQPES
jgi:hypothetical protein